MSTSEETTEFEPTPEMIEEMVEGEVAAKVAEMMDPNGTADEVTDDEASDEAASDEDAVEKEDAPIVAAGPTAKNVPTLSTLDNMPEDWFTNFGTPSLRSYLRFWENQEDDRKAEELVSQDAERWGWLPTRQAHIDALK